MLYDRKRTTRMQKTDEYDKADKDYDKEYKEEVKDE